jgi:hypothetical protein
MAKGAADKYSIKCSKNCGDTTNNLGGVCTRCLGGGRAWREINEDTLPEPLPRAVSKGRGLCVKSRRWF